MTPDTYEIKALITAHCEAITDATGYAGEDFTNADIAAEITKRAERIAELAKMLVEAKE